MAGLEDSWLASISQKVVTNNVCLKVTDLLYALHRFNVDCSASAGLYSLNEKIGDVDATFEEPSGAGGRKAEGQSTSSSRDEYCKTFFTKLRYWWLGTSIPGPGLIKINCSINLYVLCSL